MWVKIARAGHLTITAEVPSFQTESRDRSELAFAATSGLMHCSKSFREPASSTIGTARSRRFKNFPEALCVAYV